MSQWLASLRYSKGDRDALPDIEEYRWAVHERPLWSTSRTSVGGEQADSGTRGAASLKLYNFQPEIIVVGGHVSLIENKSNARIFQNLGLDGVAFVGRTVT